MRKIFILMMLCGTLFYMPAHANLTLTAKQNAPHAGDELVKQQVVFRDPGSNGEKMLWDFRHLQTINDEYSLTFFAPDSTLPEYLCGKEHRTRYYYHLQGDTLWSTGFENANTYMEYTQPEPRMRYPLTYGDTLCTSFEGVGEYGHRLPLAVKGITLVEADAEGEIIFPDEHVKKALRVRTLRHYTETGADSTEMLLDTYSWYAEGVRYPVFESIETRVIKPELDTIVFKTSFYYPPTSQRLQTEEEAEEETTIDNGMGDNTLEGVAAVFIEADLYPNPVTDMLNIDYKLTRNASIWFSLHNNQGINMLQSAPKNQLEGYHTTSINMTGMMKGLYVLYVHVDDMVMALHILKK